LEPIKNSWQELKVEIDNRAPKNRQELKHVVIGEYVNIKPDATANLIIKNYRKRLLEVIKMKDMLLTISIATKPVFSNYTNNCA
jgi:hypothetical protein